MAIKDLILSLPFVRSRVEELTTRAREEGRATRIGEAVEDDYMYRRLSGVQGVYELGESINQIVLTHCHRLYQSHGLADFIIQRAASIFLEGGLQYALTFDELPEDTDDQTRKAYDDFRRATEKRIESWWNDAEIDIDDRSSQFVDELLVSGEHGWRFDVDPSNGFVRVGDLPRTEVGDIFIDTFDTTRMRAVVPLNPADPSTGALRAATRGTDKSLALPLIRRNTETGFIEGKVAYHRLRPTSTMRRGRPVLQAVVDELSSEKTFRITATDRALVRLTTFLETSIEGMDADALDAYAKAHGGNQMPVNGQRIYVNEKMKNEFKSANIEASDVSTWIESAITVIAAAMGWPISWFSYGSSTNRATAETQEDPAYRNLNRQKRQMLKFFEGVLYFVIDSAAKFGYLYAGPEPLVAVKGRDEGTVVRKPLRQCVTVTMSTRPLAKRAKDANPMGATKAVMEILVLIKQLRLDFGAEILTPEQIAQVLNAGFAADDVGIEVFGDMLIPESKVGDAAGA